MSYAIFAIGKYWYADYQYSLGKNHNDAGNLLKAKNYLEKAIKLSDKEAVFWVELAETNTNIALLLDQEGQTDKAISFVQDAIDKSDRAINLSAERRVSNFPRPDR